MTPEEKNLITSLFERLRSSDAATRDQEADQLIRTLVAGQPSAPYLLAQTVLVQDHALQNAQARIAQLERQAADTAAHPAAQPQSFLSGLLHPRSSTPPPPAPAAAYAPAPQPPPYPSTVGMAPSAAGGFLKGALGTAAGVAGGALLFEGIQNLLGHHAGPFGSSLGGFGSGGAGFSGFSGGQPITENVENVENVTNNYYEAPESRESRDSSFLPTDNDTTSNDDPANYADDQDTGNDTYADDNGSYDDNSGGGDGGGGSWA